MELPDGTILIHARTPYDPVKAHQYYLRTRKLKGRKVGRSAAPTRKNPLIGDTSETRYIVDLGEGQILNLTKQQLDEQKAYAAERVKQIKESLKDLGSKLREAMADAKERKAKAEREAAKPPTAAEEAEAARESKQYREKHKTELATKAKRKARTKTETKSESADPVAELETKVSQIKDSLKAAVAQQRALAAATRNS